MRSAFRAQPLAARRLALRRRFQVDGVYEPSTRKSRFFPATRRPRVCRPRPPQTGGAAPGKRYGVAIVGNDKIIDWLLPFLESYAQTNAHLPLYLVPYDENVAQTRRAAELYGAHFIEEVPEAIDRLAAELYPGPFNGNRRRLRKLQALALPLDEVAYVDVDVVLFRDFSPIFGRLRPERREFIVASPSFEYVYNEKKANYPFLRDALLFNDGFWVTSCKYLKLEHFIETITRRRENLSRGAQARAALRPAAGQFRDP